MEGYNYETADDLIERLGEIISLRFIIEGPSDGINLYIDNVKFEYFQRDRAWVTGADLRIKEFRFILIKVLSNFTISNIELDESK